MSTIDEVSQLEPFCYTRYVNKNTPIVFSDGTEFYAQLAKKYIKHSSGFFILAPSASGKTYFINNQKDNDWIDGDYLWPATNADLSSDEWNINLEDVYENNRRSDVITYQAKKLGFWVIGSSNESLKPDAIVILPWETQVEYIKKKESMTYDGGATMADVESIRKHRQIVSLWEDKGVPCFESIGEAVDFLTKSSKLVH